MKSSTPPPPWLLSIKSKTALPQKSMYSNKEMYILIEYYKEYLSFKWKPDKTEYSVKHNRIG